MFDSQCEVQGEGGCTWFRMCMCDLCGVVEVCKMGRGEVQEGIGCTLA